MKNKKMFKVLTVLLFGVLIATGCSCTTSMCSEQDLNNIKTQLEEQNITGWRENFGLEENKAAYHEEFETYYATYDGDLSKAELALSLEKTIKEENPNANLTDGSKDYVATRTDAFQGYVTEKVEELFNSHPKACLTTIPDKDPSTGAELEAKTWGDAWKTGLLEGLIVYPISWLLTIFTDLFGGEAGAQIIAIVFVVFIIRLLMLVLGFKGQLGNMRMQEIQPELQALQAKVTNPNATDAEKQAASNKMLALYRDNNINPFSSFITMFIQFPLFIAVWAAMNQTVVIRTGELLGLKFGTPLNEQIFSGSISAIVLLLLMVGGQILSMKLPSILKWLKERKNPTPEYKKTNNPANKQMNTMMIMMISLVVLSAFVLPAALVIYWVIGSVFSIIQMYIFSLDSVKAKLKSLSNRKKKAKVVR